MKVTIHFLICALMLAGARVPAESASRIPESSAPVAEIRKPEFTIAGHDITGTGVIAYNPSGRFLAVSAGEKAIRIYELRPDDLTARLAKTLTGHAAQVLAIGFSDTNTLVSVSLDQTVKIWNVESGRLLHTASLPLGKQIKFSIAPGRASVAVDSSFGKARLWNYQTGEVLKTFEPNDSWVSALAFTPDGKRLVMGTDKGVVRVMDVSEWMVTRTIDLDSPVRSLAASAEHILVGYGEGTVAILNFADQTTVPEVQKQTGAINAIAFSPNGELFASASADRTIKVWDTKTLKLLCSQEGHAASVLSVTFSSNGQKMASIDAGGTVDFWTVPPPSSPSADLRKIKPALPAK